MEWVSVGKCKACALKRGRSKGSLLRCGDTTRSEAEVNASEITEARGYRSCVLVNSCCGAYSTAILVGSVVDNVTELFHE
jgi:hypothetical protein